MGFTFKDRHLTKCWNTPIGYCVDWTQKYANPSCNFLLWTVFVVFFLAECKIFNFVDVGRRSRTVSLHGWPLAWSVERLNYCWSCQHFILSVVSAWSGNILHKLAAP